MKVESAAGLEGLGEELALDAVLVSSTSIIIHTDDDGSMRTSKITDNYFNYDKYENELKRDDRMEDD